MITNLKMLVKFQHTAARRRLGRWPPENHRNVCFNTQPPEGGWPFLTTYHKRVSCFNTQPPEGGWSQPDQLGLLQLPVSTHSRPKAAGLNCFAYHIDLNGFNTQPPEGGWWTVRTF